MLTCKSLRIAVLAALLLSLGAFGLQALGAALSPTPALVPYLGLLLLMGGVLTLTFTFLLSLLPGAREGLAECVH